MKRSGLIILWILLATGITIADQQVPAGLVGQWKASQGTGSTYKDPNTGATSAPNINIFVYKILPDGTYEHAALLTSSAYNCTMQIFGDEKGTISFDGDKIIFEDKEAKLVSKDNCHPEYNYEKPGKLSRTAYSWRKETDEYGEAMILKDANGAQTRYYRMKEETK